MRTMIFVLLCFACVCATTEAVDTPRLIAHWTFDDASLVGGQYRDETGTYPASVVGSTFVSEPGIAGQAIRFNGTNNYLTLPGTGNDSEMSFDHTNKCTVSAWIKTDTLGISGDWNGIVTKGDNSWQLSRQGSSGQNIRWGSNASIYGPTPVNDNNWHLLVGTFDGTSSTLYIDGVVDAQATFAATDIKKGTWDVWIGSNSRYPARLYNGWMDDVRIYNYALSSQEIAQLYNEGTGQLVLLLPDGAVNVPIKQEFSWTPVPGAVSYDVYMGTNKGLVEAGDISVFKGNQTTLAYTPSPVLLYGTDYYWMIQVHAGDAVYQGPTHHFTTKQPGPIPSDGEIKVRHDGSVILTWDPVVGISDSCSYNVYFGTDYTEVAGASLVGMDDLIQLAEHWLEVGGSWELPFDPNPDGVINLADFSLLASYWGKYPGVNPTFKGNQTGTAFAPGQLVKGTTYPSVNGTTYFWRVDEIDSSGQVYPGNVWSFETATSELSESQVQLELIKFLEQNMVNRVKTNQRKEGYSSSDPHGIHVGEYNLHYGVVEQAYNYFLAYLYTEPRSKHYKDPSILSTVLSNLDYQTRAQGNNGGWAPWAAAVFAGVKKPDGGAASRTDGNDSVVGFPVYTFARAMLLLKDEPAFVTALSELIDNDGDGTKNITRREAYKKIFDNTKKGGPYWWSPTHYGTIYNMMNGTGMGGCTNQCMGALAAVQASNEAYRFLNNGTPFLTPTQLNAYRDKVLFQLNRIGQLNFSSQGMMREPGHGDYGYDSNYGGVTLQLLVAYANNANDPVVADFITNKFMKGYEYFFALDARVATGAYQEKYTSRRAMGPGGLPFFAAGAGQDYHPSLKLMFDVGMDLFNGDDRFYRGWPNHFHAIEFTPAIVDLLLNWRAVERIDYILPLNRPDTFTYTDLGANIEVKKTGPGIDSITWSAFNFDGATLTVSYPEDPG